MSLLPPYARPKTAEELRRQQEKVKRFAYYGIDCYALDDGSSEESQKEQDRDRARFIIACDAPMPKDLEERLLRYKAEDEERRKKHGRKA